MENERYNDKAFTKEGYKAKTDIFATRTEEYHKDFNSGDAKPFDLWEITPAIINLYNQVQYLTELLAKHGIREIQNGNRDV